MLVHHLQQDYTRSGFVVTRQFLSRLFATLEHAVILLNVLPDSWVNCRQLFAVRVLRIWNSLPDHVVSAAHLSLFIHRLVQVNLNQFLIGKM